jgi:Fic-DOC domain mobile mystery protein B
VSDIFDPQDDAATPLSESERRDLKLAYITTRDELNAAEEANIVEGHAWAHSGRRRNLLTESFIKTLHRRMFGDVWRWAGEFRATERNIGINHWEIPMELRNVLDDVRVWIEHQSYPPDEIAVRLHHRLAQIHPFPNGNGRHARLMADLLIVQLGGEPFSWGNGVLRDTGELRRRYVDALQAADLHDIGPLLAFARS